MLKNELKIVSISECSQKLAQITEKSCEFLTCSSHYERALTAGHEHSPQLGTVRKYKRVYRYYNSQKRADNENHLFFFRRRGSFTTSNGIVREIVTSVHAADAVEVTAIQANRADLHNFRS